MKSIDLLGQTFGDWTVIENCGRKNTNSPSKPLYWKCKCVCGTERIIPSHNLRCKRTTNCGCRNVLPDFKRTYNSFLKQNEKRAECYLSFDDFLKFTSTTTCHYCHTPIRWNKHGKLTAYNLDRKDSQLGYTVENCVVCCHRCNFGKARRFSYAEWYEMTECFRRKRASKE